MARPLGRCYRNVVFSYIPVVAITRARSLHVGGGRKDRLDNSEPPNPVDYLSRISVPRANAEAYRGGFVESILPTTANM